MNELNLNLYIETFNRVVINSFYIYNLYYNFFFFFFFLQT